MRLINPSVKKIEQGSGIDSIFRHIEICGRTCYKSEDRITDDSATKFFVQMVNSGHLAMLEHGTVYLKILMDPDWVSNMKLINQFRCNPYSIVNIHDDYAYITTNMRVMVENFGVKDHWKDIIERYALDEPSNFHDKRITAHFVISRGIANEFVRHRVFSFAQESTRFCNYSKDKFGNEITLIKPHWLVLPDGILDSESRVIFDHWEEWDDYNVTSWLEAMNLSEQYYFTLLNGGLKAQDARGVLPLDLKTELIMTGTEEQWNGFFALRYFEKTGKAHPDAKAIASKWFNELNGIAAGK